LRDIHVAGSDENSLWRGNATFELEKSELRIIPTDFIETNREKCRVRALDKEEMGIGTSKQPLTSTEELACGEKGLMMMICERIC
jgi:hypothetical protein